MDIEEGLDIVPLVVITLKMKRKKERIISVRDIFKTRERFGIQRFGREM